MQLDVTPLAEPRDHRGASQHRYLYGAVDRYSRSVLLAVRDDETLASVIAFLKEATQTLPLKVTRVLTDRHTCFVADGLGPPAEGSNCSTGFHS